MKNKSSNFLVLIIALLSITGLSSCSKRVVYTAPPSISQEYIAKGSAKKKTAFQFTAVAKNNAEELHHLLSESFISHDYNWGGEKGSFLQKRNSDSSFYAIQPVRILHDSNYVAVQSRMLGDTLRFRWDIVRFENQKIQEHWSNVADSSGLNPDGHTEIDGPTLPTHFEQTDTNRAHIKHFMDQCMIREDGGAPKFFNFGLYIQHNHEVGDGLNGLLWAMVKMKMKGKVIKFKNNFLVIAEGNFVLSATEGYVGEHKSVFFDFFRVEENKIVEHWDIIAPVDQFIYFNRRGNNAA